MTKSRKHSLMGSSINQKLKNTKHLESANIDSKIESFQFVMKMANSCSLYLFAFKVGLIVITLTTLYNLN